VVCNLAAQAGVRYSIENPDAYIASNVIGFFNILECSRKAKIKHFVYASSSSVYGLNAAIPFSTEDRTDAPISLYAATKKSNELIAHSYSHLYQLVTTGLRFFTVYGPWGRPDMAPFLFANAIYKNEPIRVFNKGKMKRDFTYISDIVDGTLRVIGSDVTNRININNYYEIFNIGNGKSVALEDFIHEIEANLDKQAMKTLLSIQPGDVENTWANISKIEKAHNYKSKTNIKKGVAEFILWFNSYYH
jgi:UDP-glucuronate 4-epimerase